MFQNIENQIIKKYNQNEEYLIDHYPSNEFHIQGGKKNFFTNLHNNLPSSFQIPEEWIKENFSDSHTILITSYEKDLGLKTYAVLSNTVVSSADLLFWKDLL